MYITCSTPFRMCYMKPIVFIPLILLILLFSESCEVLKHSSKYSFSEGYYKSRLEHKKLKNVYVIPADDSIKIYTAKRLRDALPDTTSSLKIAFPAQGRPSGFTHYTFRQNTFDVDVLSILLKYRPAIHGFPNQLNTSILNGAVYLGYRTDLYRLKYKQTPFRIYKRDVTHYGFSFGVFTGIGATRMDEFVTLHRIDIQYDGFVNPSGVAAIVGVDKLSFGLLLGEDHLLDKNRKLWIYQGKPWIGLSVGLNLN